MAKRPELLVVSGELSGRRFSVPNAGLRLGRSSSNDIAISDEGLSRSHCLIECEGAEGLRLIDLASANGTYVNGEQLTADPCTLKVDDVIEIGSTVIKVVGDDVTPVSPTIAEGGAVDLGLGAASANSGESSATGSVSTKRSPLAGILWSIVAVSILAAIVLVLSVETPSGGSLASAILPETTRPALTSLMYEKVEADATRIFRYYMTIDAEGVLRVVYDDIPEANRHVNPPGKKLDARATARILEILDTKGWDELDQAYTGPRAAEENALKSWRIRTVRGTQVWDVLVENMPEPEPFKLVREALEAFSRNELGIWAIQYSREQLVKLSAESEQVGNAKWEERDVEYGNLSAAIDAYREAIFYLETVNPKPEGYADLKGRLDRTIAELEARYKDQRFRAEKAIKLADWEAAQTELRILCDLVPNKNDPRHDEANAKLVDVANRMDKKTRKGGR